jgi:hypothetical protein
VSSLGSARRNHIEADLRIHPKWKTPNLKVPNGLESRDLLTFVVEVGLSQSWTLVLEKRKIGLAVHS